MSINAFFNEAGAEILKALRAPEFILPTLAMPVAFYTLFAIILPNSGNAAASLLATFGIFAVMGPAIFGFGAGVANERDRGWLNIKRASPAPGWVYIAAKMFATLFFAMVALVLMYIVAGFFAGVAMPRVTWATLMGVHLIASIPFVMLGLIFGFLFNANGAVAISNIVFLALSALGGLWIPIYVFPKSMQNFATFLPSFHLGEIALSVVNNPVPVIPRDHVSVTLVMTALLSAVALLAWARQRS